MYVGFNELSLHGQLAEHEAPALLRSMLQCRKVCADHESPLRCRRELLERPVSAALTLREVVFRLGAHDNIRRLLLQWLTKEGPFLDEERLHDADVWFECNGEVVTDWTLAELAHRGPDGCSAVSERASTMNGNPLVVTRIDDAGQRVDLAVLNHVDNETLRHWLASCEPPMRSWRELQSRSLATCSNLFFSADAFAPLERQPFFLSAAEKLFERLRVLSTLKGAFDATGAQTAEGQALRQKHFTGDKAWFTDSSDSEKSEFATELTFAHPERAGEKLFCPWHGKVKTPQMRIHFSAPINHDAPVYVVYVGPKITKR
jgi:hypothetical protein